MSDGSAPGRIAGGARPRKNDSDDPRQSEYNPEDKEKEKQTTAKLLSLDSDVLEALFSLANLY